MRGKDHLVPNTYSCNRPWKTVTIDQFTNCILCVCDGWLPEPVGQITDFEKLEDIKIPIDIVDVFRPSKEVFPIAEDTVKIGAKVLWLQLGIKDENAKELVEKNDIEYIENKCTKMEYQKYFLKKRQAFPVLSN